MPLLKHVHAQHATTGAVVLDMGDLRRQADDIIQEARDAAAAIMAAAREEAQVLIDTADERGHREGRERGEREGRVLGTESARAEEREAFHDQLTQLVKRWTEAIDQWEQDRNDLILAAREDVLTFAFRLGEKVVLRTCAVDHTVVADQLTESLALLSRKTAVRVAVNPEDRPLVDEVLPGIVSRLGTCTLAGIQEDAAIRRGGCIVRTEAGEVDATIDLQLERLAEALVPGLSVDDAPPPSAGADEQGPA